MAYFVFSYDLTEKSSENYQILEAWLETMFECAHVQDSVWVVQADIKAGDLKELALAYVEEDDYIFVAPIAGKPRWNRVLAGAGEWLREHFPR
jgi:hypothetical protein